MIKVKPLKSLKWNHNVNRNNNKYHSTDMETIKCQSCMSNKIEYYDETDEELIYKCLNCSTLFAIPLNTRDLSFYFNFKIT